MIPSWLASHLNEQDLLAIETAVAQAETRTAGEIVPVIVQSSSYSGHVQIVIALVSLLFFTTTISVLNWYLPHPIWVWELVAVALSLAAAFLLPKFSSVRRALTPPHDLAGAVFRRAQLEFHETGIPVTTGKTGILIFVSMHEHRAVVLGDKSISEKLKPEVWIGIVDQMLAKFREGKMRDGFTGAIAEVGEILAREFPIQPDDVNELPNKLIVKD